MLDQEKVRVYCWKNIGPGLLWHQVEIWLKRLDTRTAIFWVAVYNATDAVAADAAAALRPVICRPHHFSRVSRYRAVHHTVLQLWVSVTSPVYLSQVRACSLAAR